MLETKRALEQTNDISKKTYKQSGNENTPERLENWQDDQVKHKKQHKNLKSEKIKSQKQWLD